MEISIAPLNHLIREPSTFAESTIIPFSDIVEYLPDISKTSRTIANTDQ
jgi:hypothetical protein